jgi:hypothetical protein
MVHMGDSMDGEVHSLSLKLSNFTVDEKCEILHLPVAVMSGNYPSYLVLLNVGNVSNVSNVCGNMRGKVRQTAADGASQRFPPARGVPPLPSSSQPVCPSQHISALFWN